MVEGSENVVALEGALGNATCRHLAWHMPCLERVVTERGNPAGTHRWRGRLDRTLPCINDSSPSVCSRKNGEILCSTSSQILLPLI
jgi:hypothetical protein